MTDRRFDGSNPNYPNHVWDKVDRCWVRKEQAAPNGENRGNNKTESIVVMANEIEPDVIIWRWKNFLAAGMLHIFAGAPETGKTTLALAYAATISAGMRWPDGTKAEVGKVLIWTNEDDVAKTIIPRLIRMCADMANIGIVKGQRDSKGNKRPFNPATDMPSLAAKAAEMGGVVLLVLDPVVAAVPVSKNSHNNAETRSGLQPVVDFAEETQAAVIGITHFTKGTSGKDPIERITGSLAFGALPRIVMATAKNLADGPPRIFVKAKNNLGPSGGGFGYDLEAGPISYEHPDIVATRVVWLELLEGTARELLADAEAPDEGKPTKIEQAKRLLQDLLAKGERPQTEIEAAARKEGISEYSLRKAKSELHITARKDGLKAWLWGL
jgi:putative DNA primase/helicase